MRMRQLFLAVLVIAAVSGGLAGSAHAQDLSEPRARQGYYVAGGFHAALSYNRDDGEGLGPWNGFGTTIRVGQLLTRRLGLGMQIDVSGASGDGQTASLIGLGVTGQVEIARNLALHAGVGLGVISLNDNERDELTGGYGAAYTLAMTYDWFPFDRRTGGWALTPGVLLRAVPSDTIDAYAVLAGLEISWWSGLPRNQLALPDSEAYARR
jgi:opacity protein-like surface antigen